MIRIVPFEHNSVVRFYWFMMMDIFSTTVTAGENSIYNAGSKEVNGYYRVISKEKNIKKAKVKVINPARLHYANGKAINIFEATDLEVMLNGEKVSPANYEIISIKNNIIPGRAEVTIRGKGEYGGQKTFKCKIIKNALDN